MFDELCASLKRLTTPTMDSPSEGNGGGRWITVHPNGEEGGKGRPIHINANGNVDSSGPLSQAIRNKEKYGQSQPSPDKPNIPHPAMHTANPPINKNMVGIPRSGRKADGSDDLKYPGAPIYCDQMHINDAADKLHDSSLEKGDDWSQVRNELFDHLMKPTKEGADAIAKKIGENHPLVNAMRQKLQRVEQANAAMQTQSQSAPQQASDPAQNAQPANPSAAKPKGRLHKSHMTDSGKMKLDSAIDSYAKQMYPDQCPMSEVRAEANEMQSVFEGMDDAEWAKDMATRLRNGSPLQKSQLDYIRSAYGSDHPLTRHAEMLNARGKVKMMAQYGTDNMRHVGDPVMQSMNAKTQAETLQKIAQHVQAKHGIQVESHDEKKSREANEASGQRNQAYRISTDGASNIDPIGNLCRKGFVIK